MFLAIGIGALALLGATRESEAMSSRSRSRHIQKLKKAYKRAKRLGKTAKAQRLKKMLKMYN